MARLKGAAAMLTAAEAARRWAQENPDKADEYIDKATGFIDRRTKGKYHSRIGGLSSQAKKALTGRSVTSGNSETVPGETTSRTDRPFPDVRA